MICSSCQREIPDGLAFCKYCGAPTTPPPEPDRFCGYCGKELEPGLKFCVHCGSSLEEPSPDAIQVRPLHFDTAPAAPAEPPVVQQPPIAAAPKKRRNALWISLSVIAIVLVIAIVIGCMTNWFGYYGPTTKIINAAQKTLTSENYTITLNATAGNYDAETITMQVALDIEDKVLTVVGYEGDDITMIIYEGYQYSYVGYSGKYIATDISDTLNEFFDALDSDGPFDLAELIRDLDEDLYDDMAEDLYMDKLDDCSTKIMRQYNSDQWLKDTAGMTTKKNGSETVYRFSPDTYELVYDTFSLTKETFRDPDEYDEMMDSLEDAKYDVQEVEFDLSFTLSRGELTRVLLETVYDDRDVKLDLEFSNIGTTDIDYDLLDDIYAEAVYP